MSCNCGRCSSTSTAACRRLSTVASRMSCSSGRCSSSLTATCQLMGVIDLLFTAEYQKKKKCILYFVFCTLYFVLLYYDILFFYLIIQLLAARLFNKPRSIVATEIWPINWISKQWLPPSWFCQKSFKGKTVFWTSGFSLRIKFCVNTCNSNRVIAVKSNLMAVAILILHPVSVFGHMTIFRL